MAAYLSSYRRTFAVIVLAVACVLATGWMRSVASLDVLRIPIGFSTRMVLYSGDGRFGGGVFPTEWPPVKSPKWFVRRFTGTLSMDSSEVPFGSVSVAYWSKVVPMICISAYLLFVPPRSRKQRPAAVRFDYTGTRRDYLEVCLVAFLILANLDIITAFQMAFC